MICNLIEEPTSEEQPHEDRNGIVLIHHYPWLNKDLMGQESAWLGIVWGITASILLMFPSTWMKLLISNIPLTFPSSFIHTISWRRWSGYLNHRRKAKHAVVCLFPLDFPFGVSNLLKGRFHLCLGRQCCSCQHKEISLSNCVSALVVQLLKFLYWVVISWYFTPHIPGATLFLNWLRSKEGSVTYWTPSKSSY